MFSLLVCSRSLPMTIKYGITKPISLAGPTEVDLLRNAELGNYLMNLGLYENKEEGEKREDVLNRIREVMQWVFSELESEGALLRINSRVFLLQHVLDHGCQMGFMVTTVIRLKVIIDYGFSITKEMKIQLDEVSAGSFYAEHSYKSFFRSLFEYMTSSGLVLVMLLEKNNVVAGWRELIGPTNAEKAKVTHPQRFLASAESFAFGFFHCYCYLVSCFYLRLKDLVTMYWCNFGNDSL
ncbi:putative nucleoside diphosphate kinase 5 [Bienertia sinuspersici]